MEVNRTHSYDGKTSDLFQFLFEEQRDQVIAFIHTPNCAVEKSEEEKASLRKTHEIFQDVVTQIKDVIEPKIQPLTVDIEELLKEFANPQNNARKYAGWFKQLVIHIKQSSTVDKKILQLADCIHQNYNKLIEKTKRGTNKNDFYKNAAKFFYELHIRSKREDYLTKSGKFAYKWSRTAKMEEKVNFYVTNAKIYIAEKSHILAKSNLKKGLNLDPQNLKLLELQKRIEDLFPRKNDAKRKLSFPHSLDDIKRSKQKKHKSMNPKIFIWE